MTLLHELRFAEKYSEFNTYTIHVSCQLFLKLLVSVITQQYSLANIL